MKFTNPRLWVQVAIPCLLATSMLTAQVAPDALQGAAQQEEIAKMKAMLVEQQKQLEQLRVSIAKQQELLDKVQAQKTNTASLGEVASVKPVLPMPAVSIPAAATTLGAQVASPAPESPLFFKIGAANFTPFGFADLIGVVRSTNLGSGIGTSFGGLPYSNSVAGNLSETRLSMQNSRLGLRVDSAYKDIKVLGYVEADFLGNAPNNLFVTSNAATNRLRLYWVDVKKGPWEVLGGQSWTLLTPNRKGLSALPSDLFYSQVLDTNYMVGLTWSRDPGVRFIYTPSSNVSFGVSVENPEQFVGTLIAYPAKLATAYAGELSTGAATTTPNLAPDVIAKIAFDGNPGGHAAHLEFAGIVREFKTYNPLTKNTFTTVGGGGSMNFNFELAKGFRLIGNTFASAGGARYIFGLGPDVAIRPDGSPVAVKAYSTVGGFEWQANPKTLFYAYYGGAYFAKATYVDVDGKIVGFGIPGAAGSNRTVQEFSAGFSNNFWKSPQYGSLSLGMQYAYLSRSPWALTDPTAPKNANLSQGMVNFRYTLP